jgi:hypothetical protein
MPRFTRSPAIGRVYTSVLEKCLPGLEKLLCAWLRRLEAKVAGHELWYGQATAPTSRGAKEFRRQVKADLDVGEPSVIVLGARLNSDRKLCRTLMRRATALLRDKQQPQRGPDSRRVPRVPEYCQQ